MSEGPLAIAFTDVEASTDLRTSRGDVGAHEVLRAHEQVVRAHVEKHGGREVKHTGDGFMLAFTSTKRAVSCAVDIQKAIEGGEVRVRIGLNVGEVIEEDGDLFGEAVNAAARICAKAKGGEILVSDVARQLAGTVPDVTFRDRGRFRLKGFPERWRLYEAAWQPEASAPVALAERTAFVGREAELSELRTLVDQSIGGRGGLVLISGEPGVGKTRLADEGRAYAESRGMRTRVGRCYEMDGAPPYIPFVEMLESATHDIPLDLYRQVLGDDAPEIARIMPKLRRVFPDIPPPLELPPEQERRYLLNAICSFIGRAASVRPQFLLVDDLHWADEGTLLVVSELAERLASMRVCVVGTYRDVELDVARPLARVLENLLRRRLARRIGLGRLPEADVTGMLQALGGQPPPEALVHAVFAETEGNPFFVEEVFKHLAEQGQLLDADGRFRAGIQIDELDVPEGVRLVIGRRLERLDETTRRVLGVAAIVGRGFTFELLQAIVDTDSDVLLDAVDEAERARLVVSIAEGQQGRMVFAHELIRQTLLAGLSLPRRQRLHLRVADAMERAYAANLDDYAADIAHHLYQGGVASDPDRTARYLMLAAAQAQASAAFEDALQYLDSAVSLQPEDARVRADLMSAVALARRSLGRWDDAQSAWRDALTDYETLGDTDAVGRIALLAAQQLTWVGRFVESTEMAARGLAALGERTTGDRACLLARAGFNLGLGGFLQQGAPMVDEALELAEELRDDAVLAYVLYMKASQQHFALEVGSAAEIYARAIDLLERTGSVWDLANALGFLPLDLILSNRVDDARETADRARALAERIGNLGAVATAIIDNAYARVVATGDFGALESDGARVVEIGRTIGSGMVSFSGHTCQGLARFWGGRWDAAAESHAAGAALEPRSSLSPTSLTLLFVCRVYAGERVAAEAMIDELTAALPREGQLNGWGAWCALAALVEGLVLLGRSDEAAALYPLTLEAMRSGRLADHWRLRLLQSQAGLAAAAGGDFGRAEEHFETALRQADEIPIVIEQPETRRLYAGVLVERDGPGDRKRARDLLLESVAGYARLGMPRHRELAQVALDSL